MNIADRIQAYFNSEKLDLKVVESTKQLFIDAVLADGTPLQIEPALEVGAAVVVVLEDEVVPAPDGDHVLEDNTVITVEGGLITNIMPAEEEVSEEVVEEEVVEELEKEPTAIEREAKKVIESIITEKQFSELQAETKELSKTVKFLKEENESLTKLFNDKFNELGGLFTELFAEPTQEPIKKTKNPLTKESKNIFLKVKK